MNQKMRDNGELGHGGAFRTSKWRGYAIVVVGLAAIRPVVADPPNIIVIMTDDQRWDTLPGAAPEYMPQDVMPRLKANLIDQGFSFSQALVTAPLCCPSRASFLSGGFQPFHAGVRHNTWPVGGARRFYDRRTLVTFLKSKGYRTALVGKYLNEYALLDGVDTMGDPIPAGRYVPPAWDVWIGQDNENYFDYDFTAGMSGPTGPERGLFLPEEIAERDSFLQALEARGFPMTTADYLRQLDVTDLPYITYFQRDLALSFLDDASNRAEPFFLMVNVHADHVASRPAPEDADLFQGFEYRARGWGEPALADKPDYIQEAAEPFDDYYDGTIPFVGDGRSPDELFTDMLRTLVAVDRLVEDVVETVESDPNLRDDTWYVFSSDHGYLWGEHRVFHKELPYEESIRVPLVIRAPGQDQPQTIKKIVTTNLDIPATLLNLAGYSESEIKDAIGSDGVSLLPLLDGSVASVRKDVILEDFRISVPGWSAIRDQKWKYVSFDDGQEEFYNLKSDPYELRSQHDSQEERHMRKKAKLARKLADRRGLMFLHEQGVARTYMPNANVGVDYERPLQSLGGVPPVTWDLYEDDDLPPPPPDCELRLPDGLEVAPDGLVRGTPGEEGCFVFWVRGRDSSSSPIDGRPQTFYKRLRLKVNP